MKKTGFFFITSMGLLLFSCTKTNRVPEKIKTDFKDRFMGATETKWEKETETQWEANFIFNHKSYSASYSSDGEWLETEYEIEKKELPLQVSIAMEIHFVGFDMKEVERSESYSGIMYEIKMERGQQKLEVIVDGVGNIIEQNALDQTNPDT